ncbi:MAG: GDP-L-fucose synthase [Bacteroidetes bacterium]|nr:GDP-L-fucose synthase [Bacteroidota bacterium]
MDKLAKIYVAGHNGMVGSAIWKNLENKGYTNLIGRSSKSLDLRNQVDVDAFFATEQPEYVFLAAAKVGGIIANSTYRADFIYENMMIQNNIIHCAWKYNVKKLLFLGSTCIYPRDAAQPMAENCLLTNILEYTNEPYAIAKIAGLKLCESYNLQYDTNFIAVMPTNLYGPNDNFDLERSHVLPALIRKMYLGSCLEKGDWNAIRSDLTRSPIAGVEGSADEHSIIEVLGKFGIKTDGSAQPANNVSVEVWGSGRPMREFLWSEEMADACVYIMERVDFKALAALSGEKDVRNCHINIGTGKEISINDLALLIKEKVGFNGSIVFDASKPDGTMRKLTDPSKLHALGWNHHIDIEEGIEQMLGWYLGRNID